MRFSKYFKRDYTGTQINLVQMYYESYNKNVGLHAAIISL